MQYILELHRPESISIEDFNDKYLKTIPNIFSMGIFMSVSEWLNYVKNNKISTELVDTSIIALDIDKKYDTYFVNLNVPNEKTYLMYNGRGKLLPVIQSDRIIRLDYIKKGGQ